MPTERQKRHQHDDGGAGGRYAPAMTTILVVDDEPAIRESLGFALGREGFEVRAAGSAATAWSGRPAEETSREAVSRANVKDRETSLGIRKCKSMNNPWGQVTNGGRPSHVVQGCRISSG